MREAPVIGPNELSSMWNRYRRPMLIAAVSSRGARKLIREALKDTGLTEVEDYLCAA